MSMLAAGLDTKLSGVTWGVPGTHRGEAATETADTETRSSVWGWVRSEGYSRQHHVTRMTMFSKLTISDTSSIPSMEQLSSWPGCLGSRRWVTQNLLSPSLPPRSPRVSIPFSLLSLAWCDTRYDGILTVLITLSAKLPSYSEHPSLGPGTSRMASGQSIRQSWPWFALSSVCLMAGNSENVCVF